MILNPYFLNSRAGLNPYLSINGENYDNTNEQNVMKSLQKEHIQMFGVSTTYIVRTNNTVDEVFGETIGTTFSHTFSIEMYPSDTSLMQGHDSVAQFGYNMADTIVLHVSFERIVEEFAKLGIEGRKYPIPGDLIAFSIPGNILEIKYVEDKLPSFALGAYSLYALTCQVYDQGTEVFDTGVENIDVINSYHDTLDMPFMDNSDIIDEANESVIKEPNLWENSLTKDFTNG